MSSWGARRQLSITLVFLIMLIFGVIGLLVITRDKPSCFDGIQNQNELNVDCGGECVAICAIETTDPIVLWSRVFQVREGVYDVAVLVENPNPFFLGSASYTIKIHDQENLLVKTIRGSIELNPTERTIIFEPNIDVGFRIPTTAFVSFDPGQSWRRVHNVRKPVLAVGGKDIVTDTVSSTISAPITNESLFDANNIILYALVYDKDQNVTAVSKSVITTLGSGQSEEVFFTWPIPFVVEPFAVEILALTEFPKDAVVAE